MVQVKDTEKILVESLLSFSEREGCSFGEVLSIEKLTGDASTRGYFRVKTEKDSYVVCLDEPIKEDSEKNDFLEVQKVLLKEGIRVPEIHHHLIEKGYLLEEDLGDITFLKYLATVGDIQKEKELYRQAIDEMIKMHSIDSTSYDSYNFSKLSFDHEKLFSEMKLSIHHFLERFLGANFTEDEREEIESSLSRICHILAQEKKVFTHRDYHSRNLMVKNDRLVVIDFQDCRQGIPQYDLASLLDDCYYRLNPQNILELKKYYFESFSVVRDYQESFDRFLYLYDLMKIQRVFKALGTFSYIYYLRGDIRYLKYIGYGFEKLKTTLLNYDEFKGLRSLLSKAYYEA